MVAILFADLCGSTTLASELGAEEMHRLLTRYFEHIDALIAQCGGTVDKHIGDGIMALFGAPVAHGNDTLRALRTSVAIHQAMEALGEEWGRPLAVHVGVASGEVVAADTGSAVHRTYTVTGDAVNLAARLLEVAHAGETVISDDVHRECRPAIEADALATMPIRGFASAMPAWRLRSLRADSAVEHALLGRDGEVARFEALLEGVASTGRGAACVVCADPGMGKTRLVQEFAARAGRRGFAVYTATVLDFGAAQGRDAIHAVLASILGVPAEGGAADRRAALERAVAVGDVAADDEPFASEILGIAQRDAAMYEAMGNATRGEGRVRTVARAVMRAAQRQPTLIIGEDLHWATPVVLAGVRAVIDAAQRVPLLVVGTSRREGNPFGMPPLDLDIERCDLAPLSTRDALALARSYLTANPQVAAGCVERAQGNPLFLTQLLRNGADGAFVPATIQSVVQSRLDRLAPADKRALQAAAVIGQRFDLALLRHLLDEASYDATALLGRDLVRGDADGRHYAFAHALIRDGAYASLLHSARRALHLSAAGWFASRDVVLAAGHLDRAGDAGAAAAYLAAARTEVAALRFDSALRLVRRGAQLPAGIGVAHALAQFEGDLARDVGDIPASLAAFERAERHATSDEERCAALAGLATAHRATGGVAEGLAVLDALEPLALSAHLPREASRAAYLRGCFEFARGDVAASRAAQTRALASAQDARDAECEAHALSGLADVLYADGRMHSAYAAFERCVALSDREGLARFALNNRAMLAVVHSYLAPLDGALHVLERVRAVARELRQRAAEMMADESEAWVRVSQGLYEEAIAPAERSLALAREIGSRRFVQFDQCLLAYACWHVGRRDDAVAALDEAYAVAEEVGMRFAGGQLLGGRALMARDREALAAVAEEAERVLAAGTPAHSHFWYRREAIEASLAFRDFDAVRHHAAALAVFTRIEPVPAIDFVVARALALAAAGCGSPDRTALAVLRERAVELHWPGMIPALDGALARGAGA